MCITLMAIGCGKDVGRNSQRLLCQHLPGFEHVALSGAKAPYKISAARRRELLDSYDKLQLGMDEKQVFDLLGKPDAAYEGWSKENNPARCIGEGWRYWFDTDDTGNTHDQILYVFFGHNGRVHWIDPSNISGLKEKGRPAQSH